MVVEFAEVSAVCDAGAQLLERFYDDCLIPAIPHEDQRDSLDDIRDSLHRYCDGEYGVNSYRVIVACHEDRPVGGVIFDYFAGANAGVIEYLVVSPRARRTGIGTELLKRTELMMSADARRVQQQLAWLASEVEDPLRTPSASSAMDPFERGAVWDRWGFRVLDFPYMQPSLSEHKMPVHTLLMEAKALAPKHANFIPTDALLKLLRDYFHWGMRIDDPAADPNFQSMSEYLLGAGTVVPAIALREYLGRRGAGPSVCGEPTGR
jgi:GNAT superfamily N-acetyltransferase